MTSYKSSVVLPHLSYVLSEKYPEIPLDTAVFHGQMLLALLVFLFSLECRPHLACHDFLAAFKMFKPFYLYHGNGTYCSML